MSVRLRHGRRAARGPPVRPGRAAPAPGTPEARLGGRPQGAAPAGRHPATGLARVQGRPSRRLRLLLVLPCLSGLAGPARPGHAPGAPCRRQDVRRLGGADHPDHRPGYRRGLAGAAVRRGAGCQQLHLRRGVRIPVAARLDRRAPPRVLVVRGCQRGHRPGQHALRGDPGPPLRTRPPPDLRGDGDPSRRRRDPRTTPEAPGQGEGGIRRPARRAVGRSRRCATARSSASRRPTPPSASGSTG